MGVGCIMDGIKPMTIPPAAVISLVRGMAAHIVSGLSPILLAPPGLLGVASLGHTLSAAPGSWANHPVAIAQQHKTARVTATDVSAEALE